MIQIKQRGYSQGKKSFHSRGHKPSPLFIMNIWSQLEKGYQWQQIPTRASHWDFLTTTHKQDGVTVPTWLEAKWIESILVCSGGEKHTQTQPACSIWVIELTDSGMWMCVCWQTPLHPEWGLWLHLIMRVASALSPCSLRFPSPPSFSLALASLSLPLSSHHGASWAIMWSHYLTPRCSRVQLTKTARGPSCGKDSVGT